MKKYSFIALCLCVFCNLNAQEVYTLDLESSDYEFFEDKEYWKETYNTQESILSFNGGMFNFSHIPGQFGGTDVGGGMSYWDGFTICRSGDTTDYGMIGNSDGWVPQQWGCMAGGGLNSNFQTEQGKPYLVAYWGYYYETEGVHACQVDFDGETHRVKGTYICNHPWPYYGNIHGDGFAGAFATKGDYFTITAHGMLNGEDTGSSVTMTLAENDGSSTQQEEGWPKGLVQSKEWQWMDLSELGEVDAVYFTMATSDADPLYGPNTAVYFCLDKMQIYEHEETSLPARPTGLTASDITENSVTLSWNTSAHAEKYAVYLDDEKLAETTQTSYTFRGLYPYRKYTLKVVANNQNGDSDPTSIDVQTIDVTAPSAPSNISVTPISCYKVQLNWTASTDNVAVTRYRIYVNGKEEAHPKTNSYTITGLDPCTKNDVEISAIDASKNESAKTHITILTPKAPGAIDGDVNSDGVVDVNDIQHLADIITGKVNTRSMMGDLNGDHVISILDLTRLIKKINQ